MISDKLLYEFAQESNEIERIYTERRHLNHAAALRKLLNVSIVTIEDLVEFVKAIEPGAYLRSKPEHRVWIGGHEAMPGPWVQAELPRLLQDINNQTIKPIAAHQMYEHIHPFIDGNGRSGRALWLWQMVNQHDYNGCFKFLQMYYYQTLE